MYRSQEERIGKHAVALKLDFNFYINNNNKDHHCIMLKMIINSSQAEAKHFS